MSRMIKVTGNGKISVPADLIQVIFSLEDKAEIYEKAVSMSGEQTEQLRSCLAALGFKKSDLKTVSFHISPNYEEKSSLKRKLEGYTFTHRMKLEFERNGERLDRVIRAVSECGVKPLLQINYSVADPDKVKTELIEKAVADSRNKAESLAMAAGVLLGKVLEVNYSWDEMDLYTRPTKGLYAPMMLCEDARSVSNTPVFDLEPEDIEVTDTVTVVWEIQ